MEKCTGGAVLYIHSSFNIAPYLKAFHLSNHPSIQPSLHSFCKRPAMHPFIHLFIDATNSPTLPPNHASIFLSIFLFPLSPNSPSSIRLSISTCLRLYFFPRLSVQYFDSETCWTWQPWKERERCGACFAAHQQAKADLRKNFKKYITQGQRTAPVSVSFWHNTEFWVIFPGSRRHRHFCCSFRMVTKKMFSILLKEGKRPKCCTSNKKFLSARLTMCGVSLIGFLDLSDAPVLQVFYIFFDIKIIF